MIADDTIGFIKTLFVQFHWQRIGVDVQRHNNLILELKKYPITLYNGYGKFK
jgi:hypothetical protein